MGYVYLAIAIVSEVVATSSNPKASTRNRVAAPASAYGRYGGARAYPGGASLPADLDLVGRSGSRRSLMRSW